MVSSKVDDYKYCPEIYKNLSLYEWTRLSVKINAKLKKNDPTYLQFLSGHNQRKTHKVKCITSRSDTFILNFIGGTLPRRDQGDYDYYCCTMLTLFKPWRHGEDLKSVNQTWTEAFALQGLTIPLNKKKCNQLLHHKYLGSHSNENCILFLTIEIWYVQNFP